MDKRKLIRTKSYFLTDGRTINVKIYQKSNNRGMTCRINYGEVEMYVSSYSKDKDIDKLFLRAVNKPHFRGCIIDRPFMKDDTYFYMLGKKKYITRDIKFRNSDTFFYIPKTVKDPLTIYKKKYLEFLQDEVVKIGKMMGKDLSNYKIRTGLYLSYYGVCFPKKEQFKFDYRTFAYSKEIIDALIIHEVSHLYSTHHDNRFYTIVKTYCPDYDRLDRMLKQGKFEGELDYAL